MAAHGCDNGGGGGVKAVDIKRYARVEKVPGGEIEQSRVLSGVMLNKDVTHPAMRRRIVNPRIVLLDCPLEYKKGESQTNIEISKDTDFSRFQELEEAQVKAMVDKIIEFKPDLVITEKGVSGRFFFERCAIMDFLNVLTVCKINFRLRSALPLQSQHLRYSSSQEI